jgi:hypothetical protein
MNLWRRLVKLERKAGRGVAKRPVIYYQIFDPSAQSEDVAVP